LSAGGGTKRAPRNPRSKSLFTKIKMDQILIFEDTYTAPAPKRRKGNPLGEDCYLLWNFEVVRDEDKIIRAQQIFKHEYYKPDGRWFKAQIEQYGDSVRRS
jgi:hypothetical protein